MAKNCPLFVDVMKFEINYTHIQGTSWHYVSIAGNIPEVIPRHKSNSLQLWSCGHL